MFFRTLLKNYNGLRHPMMGFSSESPSRLILQKQLDSHLADGEKFLKINDLVQTRTSFNEALKVSSVLYFEDPFNVSKTSLLIAELFRKNGSPLAAVSILQCTLEMLSANSNRTSAIEKAAIKEQETKANFRLGEVFYELKDFPAYISHTVEYISDFPFEDSIDKALSYCRLGNALSKNNDKRGTEYSEKGLEIAKSTAKTELELGVNYLRLGDLFHKLNDIQAALHSIKEASKIFEKVQIKESKKVRIDCITDIAILTAYLNQEEAAQIFLTNSYDKVLFPEKIDQFFYLKNNFARISNSPVMVPVYKKIIELGKEFPEEYKKLAYLHILVGENLFLSMQLEEGLYYLEESAKISIQNKNSSDLIDAYMMIADTYINLDDDKKYKHYINLCDSILKEHFLEFAQTEVYYLKFKYHSKKQELLSAEKYAEMWAENIKESQTFPKNLLCFRYIDIGNLYIAMQKFPEALRCYELGYEITEKHMGKNTILAANYLESIGNAYMVLEQYEDSLTYLFKGLEVKLGLLESTNNEFNSLYYNIALVYFNMKEHNKALEFSGQMPLFVNLTDEKSGEIANYYLFYACVHENLTNFAEAKKWSLAAREIYLLYDQEQIVEEIDARISEFELEK